LHQVWKALHPQQPQAGEVLHLRSIQEEEEMKRLICTLILLILLGCSEPKIIEVVKTVNVVTVLEVCPPELIDATGYFYSLDNLQAKILCTTPGSCLHETCHQIDRLLEWPSLSLEWEAAIDAFIEKCIGGLNDPFCPFKDFPGIYGNPLAVVEMSDGTTQKWGGYREVYADICEHSFLTMQEKPVEIQIFYTEQWKQSP